MSTTERPHTNGSNGGGFAPPQNLEAEQSVLGAVLLSDTTLPALIIDEHLQSGDFYRPSHGTIYQAMLDLHAIGEPVDALTLVEHLKQAGQLEDVGGRAAIDLLSAAVPSVGNVRQYAKIVRDNAMLRRLLIASFEIQQQVHSHEAPPRELVDLAERAILEVAHDDRRKDFQSINDVLHAELDKLEKLSREGTRLTGTPSGFGDLDTITGGFQSGNLIILAARPSMGKCLAGSALVHDPVTGARRRIDEVVAAVEAGQTMTVTSVDSGLRLRRSPVGAAMRSGVQPVHRLTTRLGRRVDATASHPLLTLEGWRELRELEPGTRIAVPRRLPELAATAAVPEAEVGTLAARTLEEGAVPAAVFGLPDEQIRGFLSVLYGADGHAHANERFSQIGYVTTSERLAHDVQHLLLRLGIVATVRTLRRATYETARAVAREVRITSREALGAFVAGVAVPGMADQLDRIAGFTGGAVRPDQAASAVATERQTRAPDLLWDEVASIEDLGEQETYDLTVPGDHNFLADDIVVHNSALMANFAEHAALENGKAVALFSLEMSESELAQRFIASQASVKGDDLRKGKVPESRWTKILSASNRLAGSPLFIDDSSDLSVLDVRAKARRLAQQQASGLGLIIIDYLQLMRSDGTSDNRVEQIGQISRGLKTLARELGVPVIALSQLNRGVEQRTDKRPVLSDLRDSGAIEQDADLVMFIYREEYYDQDSDREGIADLIISKHRNGGLGTVELTFQKEYPRFMSYVGPDRYES